MHANKTDMQKAHSSQLRAPSSILRFIAVILALTSLILFAVIIGLQAHRYPNDEGKSFDGVLFAPVSELSRLKKKIHPSLPSPAKLTRNRSDLLHTSLVHHRACTHHCPPSIPSLHQRRSRSHWLRSGLEFRRYSTTHINRIYT